MSQWWSIALAVVGVTAMLLAGYKRAAGWAVGLVAQAIWLTYGLSTRQWAFAASSLVYGTVYTVNWRRWRRDERERANAVVEETV